MAKFPPDDGHLQDAPQQNAPVAEDGNFKRGRIVPVLVGTVVAAGIAGAIWFGFQKDKERLTRDQQAQAIQNIFILPETEQLPKWREWAQHEDGDMVQEALLQLAHLKDDEGVKLATKALERGDHAINGVAAQVLASYGSPKADEAKPALLAALKKADESDKPQLVWALVALKEPSVFEEAMTLYRDGKLAKVERLGGGAAFDPDLLAGLVSLDELSKLAGDKSQAVRQLVATVIARNAEPKWTDVLITLVNDPEMEVAGQAANGLGKIADEKARDPLLKKLAEAEPDKRQKFIEALRDGIGGEGLVLALRSVAKEPEERNWFQTDQIFKLLEILGDPRIGDSLMKWVDETNPSPHWRSEAGMRLAEVGDPRGAKFLAERMAIDPTTFYIKEKFWQAGPGGHLSRTEDHRIWAMRMLADLAVIRPDKRDDLLAAEGAVLKYITDKPMPHANGLRFLANVKSSEGLPKIREWAFPDDPLPKEGASGQFPVAFTVAQSALRYLGKYKEESDFDKIVKQYAKKKDKKMDITLEGMMGAGLSMIGMSLRALAVGASEGLGEWGDKRAVKPMMELIEDEKWHEEARFSACSALAWCATPEDMKEIALRAVKFGSEKTAPRKQLIGACYATTLSLRPMPEVAGDLVDLITPEMDPGLRNAFAQAVGASPLTDANRDKLFEKVKVPETRNAAALALILGGDASTASRTVAMYGEFDKESTTDLKDAYFRAFGFWSDEDFRVGNIYRWVENAEAISRVKIFGTPQVWATERLQAQFVNLKFDNGPHSETRIVLRYRLLKAAREGDEKTKFNAIRTLKFMKEQGSLMALKAEAGSTGEMARKAFFELMNPKDPGVDDISALQNEQKAKMKDD